MAERVWVKLLNDDGDAVHTIVDTWANPCGRDRVLTRTLGEARNPLQVARKFREPAEMRSRGGLTRTLVVTMDEVAASPNAAQVKADRPGEDVFAVTWETLEIRRQVGDVVKTSRYVKAGLEAVRVEAMGSSVISVYRFLVGAVVKTTSQELATEGGMLLTTEGGETILTEND